MKFVQSIIEMLVEAGSGHTAGPLDMADIFTLLYYETLKHNPRIPFGRIAIDLFFRTDIFVLCFTQRWHMRVISPRVNFFHSESLDHAFKDTHKEALPGIETSSGPLGSGLSQAIGMALAERN